jgi:YD repeat-containing protein
MELPFIPWANTCQNIVTTKMQYDLAGNLTQTTYPSGMVVQQSYDSAGRLCQVAGTTSSCSSPTNPWATAFHIRSSVPGHCIQLR